MRTFVRSIMTGAAVASLALPLSAFAAEQDLQQKLDNLTKEVEALKQQTKTTESKSIGKWLTIGGDYRFRVDSLKGSTAPFMALNGFLSRTNLPPPRPSPSLDGRGQGGG